MRLADLEVGTSPPDDVNVVVTVPADARPYGGALNNAGLVEVTRLYHGPLRTPGCLGVVPATAHERGAPLDALVVCEHQLPPGVVVGVRPVGVLYVSDGVTDDPLLVCVPHARLTARFADVASYADLPAGRLRDIAHFFAHVREVESNGRPRTVGWGDVSEARRVVMEAAARGR